MNMMSEQGSYYHCTLSPTSLLKHAPNPQPTPFFEVLTNPRPHLFPQTSTKAPGHFKLLSLNKRHPHPVSQNQLIRSSLPHPVSSSCRKCGMHNNLSLAA